MSLDSSDIYMAHQMLSFLQSVPDDVCTLDCLLYRGGYFSVDEKARNSSPFSVLAWLVEENYVEVATIHDDPEQDCKVYIAPTLRGLLANLRFWKEVEENSVRPGQAHRDIGPGF